MSEPSLGVERLLLSVLTSAYEEELLESGGRLSLISYHSLEDRLVKRFMRNGMFEGEPERDFFGNFKVPFKTIGKLIVPSEEEVVRNNRARSTPHAITWRH